MRNKVISEPVAKESLQLKQTQFPQKTLHALTYPNEVLQCQWHEPIRTQIEPSLSSHHHEQQHSSNICRIQVPLGSVDHVAQFQQIGMEFLSDAEQ